MRALLCTLAVALLLYGTSLFSRDRDDPRWARSAVNSTHQEEAAQRFESLTALVRSIEPLTTGSVEVRDEKPTSTPIPARGDAPNGPAITPAATAPAAERRPTLNRDHTAK